MRNWPNGSLMKAVGRLELHPVRHWVADVVVTRARGMITGSCPYIIAASPKAVSCRTLFPDLAGHVVRTGRSGCSGFTDCRRRHQQWPVALHDVNHAVFKRYFDANRVRVLRFISHYFILP